MTLRAYTESFDEAKAATIAKLIKDLDDIREFPMGYGFYTREIKNCLSVGLLMAAVSVSSSLLELFIRDLLVTVRINERHEGNLLLIARVERETEEDRSLGFNAMLDGLQDVKQPNSEAFLIDPEDVVKLKQFYKLTRIPFAHGMVRRLTSKYDNERISDLFASMSRGFSLEDRIEDDGIDEVAFVVEVLKKYIPALMANVQKQDEPRID
jgi:hypothetical protein